MLHIYIGDGKGKTTAAVGLAIRNAGCDGKVLFAQFLKSIDTGEMNILNQLSRITFQRPDMRNKGFIWNMNPQQIIETKDDVFKGFQEISNMIINGVFSLVVLDEVLDIIDIGFLEETKLIDLLDRFTATEFVLTGRKASQALKQRADYITFMKKIKHPFDKGLNARKGIEY